MRTRDPWHDDDQDPNGFAAPSRAGLSGYLLDLLAANPTATGGSAVVFVFAVAIVANAMFLQPGKHPAPLFTGLRPVAERAAPAGIATPFGVVARDGAAQAEDPAPAVQPDDPAALLRRTQAALAAEGFYRGPADGRASPQLDAAIREFQSLHGMTIDGQPSDALLFALGSPPGLAGAEGTSAPVAMRPAPAGSVLPRERPEPDMPSAPRDAIAGVLDGSSPSGEPAAAPAQTQQDNPVAASTAAPRTARADKPVPPLPVPDVARSGDTAAAPASASVAGTTTLADWQTALLNMGYGPTNTDGIMTQQTREAVMRFQHGNGMPEDGVISDRVIMEMKRLHYLQ